MCRAVPLPSPPKKIHPFPSPTAARHRLLQREDIRLHGLGRLQDRLEAADAKVEDLTREINTLRGKDEVRVCAPVLSKMSELCLFHLKMHLITAVASVNPLPPRSARPCSLPNPSSAVYRSEHQRWRSATTF